MTVDEKKAEFSDEELAAQCADPARKSDAQEELLRRYMNSIYWFPQKIMGAPEEDNAAFLEFAHAQIIQRDLFPKFRGDNNAKFKTWLMVVLRNLFLDFRRKNITKVKWQEINVTSAAIPSSDNPEEQACALLEKIDVKCRTMFKLLLLSDDFLTPEELRWLVEQTDEGALALIKKLSAIEQNILERNADEKERFAKLSEIFWWKSFYQQQEAELKMALEREGFNVPPELTDRYEYSKRQYEKRKEQHSKILEEYRTRGVSGRATYMDIARVLNLSEDAVKMAMFRCRKAYITTFSKSGDKE